MILIIVVNFELSFNKKYFSLKGPPATLEKAFAKEVALRAVKVLPVLLAKTISTPVNHFYFREIKMRKTK